MNSQSTDVQHVWVKHGAELKNEYSAQLLEIINKKHAIIKWSTRQSTDIVPLETVYLFDDRKRVSRKNRGERLSLRELIKNGRFDVESYTRKDSDEDYNVATDYESGSSDGDVFYDQTTDDESDREFSWDLTATTVQSSSTPVNTIASSNANVFARNNTIARSSNRGHNTLSSVTIKSSNFKMKIDLTDNIQESRKRQKLRRLSKKHKCTVKKGKKNEAKKKTKNDEISKKKKSFESDNKKDGDSTRVSLCDMDDAMDRRIPKKRKAMESVKKIKKKKDKKTNNGDEINKNLLIHDNKEDGDSARASLCDMDDAIDERIPKKRNAKESEKKILKKKDAKSHNIDEISKIKDLFHESDISTTSLCGRDDVTAINTNDAMTEISSSAHTPHDMEGFTKNSIKTNEVDGMQSKNTMKECSYGMNNKKDVQLESSTANCDISNTVDKGKITIKTDKEMQPCSNCQNECNLCIQKDANQRMLCECLLSTHHMMASYPPPVFHRPHVLGGRIIPQPQGLLPNQPMFHGFSQIPMQPLTSIASNNFPLLPSIAFPPPASNPFYQSHQVLLPNTKINTTSIDSSWTEHVPPSGMNFYYNSITQESTYLKPPLEWIEYNDPVTGKKYYSNGITTTWNKPFNVLENNIKVDKKIQQKISKKEDALQKEAFYKLLMDNISNITPNSKYEDVYKLLQKDKRFYLLQEESRKEMFHNFCQEMKKTQDRIDTLKKGNAIEEFKAFLKDGQERGILILSSTWSEFKSSLSECKDCRFTSQDISEEDQYLIFLEYLDQMQKIVDESMTTKICEKSQHVEYILFLRSLIKKGTIRIDSKWKAVKDTVVINESYKVVYDQDIDAPEVIFETLMKDLQNIFSKDKSLLSEILSKHCQGRKALDWSGMTFEQFEIFLLSAAKESDIIYKKMTDILAEGPISSALLYYIDLTSNQKDNDSYCSDIIPIKNDCDAVKDKKVLSRTDKLHAARMKYFERHQDLPNDALPKSNSVAVSSSSESSIIKTNDTSSGSKNNYNEDPRHMFFLASLPYNATNIDIKQWFSKIGNVHHAKIVHDNKGESRGYGFLFMADDASSKALDEYLSRHGDRITIMGRSNVYCARNDKQRERKKNSDDAVASEPSSQVKEDKYDNSIGSYKDGQYASETSSQTKNSKNNQLKCGKDNQDEDPRLMFFLANLPYTATNTDVKKWFSQFGNVHHARIICDKGKSKGYGFLFMADDKSSKALDGYLSRDGNRITIMGRRNVYCARNDEKRASKANGNTCCENIRNQ